MQDIELERERLKRLGLTRFPHLDKQERSALDFMATTGAMLASTNARQTTGRLYRSYEELVIAEGEHFTWQPRPADVPKMEDKQCFTNALLTAKERGWRYVEGFAAKLMVTMHAWCVNDAGQVIDPTWVEDDRFVPHFYLGIAMDPDKALAKAVRQGVYGILPNDISLLDADFSRLT